MARCKPGTGRILSSNLRQGTGDDRLSRLPRCADRWTRTSRKTLCCTLLLRPLGSAHDGTQDDFLPSAVPEAIDAERLAGREFAALARKLLLHGRGRQQRTVNPSENPLLLKTREQVRQQVRLVLQLPGVGGLVQHSPAGIG